MMISGTIDDLARILAVRATRRGSLGLLAAAGLAALGANGAEEAEAGRRKRRRRRKKRRNACAAQGKTCASAETCCSGTCDFLVGGGTCAPCRGRTCNAERPCCGGLACRDGYCDGCRDRATSCTASDQCCFSDCVSGACLSALGGKCARDVDCRSCYLNKNCTNACVNGTCAV
jgi:hypothetical protein